MYIRGGSRNFSGYVKTRDLVGDPGHTPPPLGISCMLAGIFCRIPVLICVFSFQHFMI